MYLTQTSFFGKTGPINPSLTLAENSPDIDRFYPNKWMEDRNLRALHNKKSVSHVLNKSLSNQLDINKTRFGRKSSKYSEDQPYDVLNCENQKYLAVS